MNPGVRSCGKFGTGCETVESIALWEMGISVTQDSAFIPDTNFDLLFPAVLQS